jgi:hypothetical protein
MVGSGLCGLPDRVADISGFERSDEIGVIRISSAQLDRRSDDSLSIVVKLFSALFDRDEGCENVTEIEKLMNVTSSCNGRRNRQFRDNAPVVAQTICSDVSRAG